MIKDPRSRSGPANRRPSRTAHRSPLPPTPLTIASAAGAGWTISAQWHAVTTGDLERIRRGVVGAPVAPEPGLAERRLRELGNLRAAQASTLTCSRAVISHSSAAVARGIPTYGDIGRPCLTVPAGTALRTLAGVHLHRASLSADDWAEVEGFRITLPARTVMDIAREHGVTAGVVAADYALHEGLTDRSRLATAYEACAGWPGRRSARLTLLSADGRSESVLESLSRLHLAAGGLSAPEPQVEICDEYGNYLGRCDFYWDEFGVVGEADGRLKYERDPAAHLAERERERALEDTGLIVVRWGWSDLYAFDRVIRRLQLAFVRGARRGSGQRRWGVFLSPTG